MRLTRREFLATTYVATAPMVRGAQALVQERDLLASAWPAPKLSEVLAPRDRFHPFPNVSERAAWEALPPDARAALLATGEAQLKIPWEVLPATLFLEYRRTGDRSHYEQARSRRRKKLQNLVIAECVEGQGRFADEIANGVWLTQLPRPKAILR